MRLFAFLQTRQARRWIPLPLSILAHAAIIAGLIYGYRSYQENSAPADMRRSMVPDSLLVENAKLGGMDHANLSTPAAPGAMQTLIAPPELARDGSVHSPPPIVAAPNAADGGAGIAPMIGLPAAPPAPALGLSSASGAPATHFMGLSGDAIRVVFVCDASGSMMDRLPSLQGQLKYSIDHLQPIQWFNVIFFQNSGAIAGNPASLIQALPANCARIEKLLPTIRARGNSNPLTAIDLAFSQHPQVIYLLTDGDFEDVADSITDQHILDEIHRLNAGGQVCINTILFISDLADLKQEDARAGRAVLQKIAAQNGGTFKVVVAE